MTNRDVNYHIGAEVKGLDAWISRLERISTLMREVNAQMNGGGRPGGLAPATSLPTGQGQGIAGLAAAAAPKAGNGIGSAARTDNYLRDLNRWAGVQNRQMTELIAAVRSLKSGKEGGGGGRGGRLAGGLGQLSTLAEELGAPISPNDFIGGPAGKNGKESAQAAADRKNLMRFFKGSQLSGIGHQIGGGSGMVLQGAGDIIQGAAAGPVGLGLGIVQAGTRFGSHLQREAEDNLKKRTAAREREAEETIAQQARGQLQFSRGLREQSLLADPMRDNGLESDMAQRRKEIANRGLQIVRNRFGNFDQTAVGKDQRLKEEDEEKGLKAELVEMAQKEVQLAQQKVRINEENFNLLNREKATVMGLIDAEQKRMQAAKADFGQLSGSKQRKTARIAEKLDSGGTLTRSELRFAENSPLLQKDAEKLYAAKAEASGNFTPGLARRAGGQQLAELEGQLKLLEDRLKSIKPTIEMDRESRDKFVADLKAAIAEASVVKIAFGGAGQDDDGFLQRVYAKQGNP